MLTAVDNSVRAAPAINARLAWAAMTRNGAGGQNLLDYLAARLGTAYAGDSVTVGDVATRLADLEAGAGSGGGGGTGREYWQWPTEMEATPSDKTTLTQMATAAAQALLDPQVARIAALEAAAGQVAVKPAEAWDSEAWNNGLLTLRLGAATPSLLYGMRNAATVIGGVYGTAAAHPDGKVFEMVPS